MLGGGGLLINTSSLGKIPTLCRRELVTGLEQDVIHADSQEGKRTEPNPFRVLSSSLDFISASGMNVQFQDFTLVLTIPCLGSRNRTVLGLLQFQYVPATHNPVDEVKRVVM